MKRVLSTSLTHALCVCLPLLDVIQISKREEKTLREWMQQIVGHDLSFKEFALALKQRASLTSPQRISILQLAKP